MLFSHAFVCSLKSQQPAVTRFKVGAEFSQGADTEKQRLLRMKKMFADISSEEQSSVSFDNNKLFSCSDINTTTEIFFIFKHFFFFGDGLHVSKRKKNSYFFQLQFTIIFFFQAACEVISDFIIHTHIGNP